MKSILIVGENSYIGCSIEKWFSGRYDDYRFDTITARDDAWRTEDFSKYDAVLHLAGMVHVKEKKENWPQYLMLNSTIPYEVAVKAKESGVKHFVFFSTKGVYAPNTPVITRNTVPTPTKLYGKSKLEGEGRLQSLRDEKFHVSILRPAVVYGEGCKGNFPRLIALSEKIHVFPYNKSKRSMIYIWNLCEYVHMLLENPVDADILFPQDKESVGIMDIMTELWKARGEKYCISRFGGACVTVLLKLPGFETLKTMFTDTVYEKSISSDYDNKYCVFTFEEAIRKITEANSCEKGKGHG